MPRKISSLIFSLAQLCNDKCLTPVTGAQGPQARFGLTILFISHNLAVVRQMADDIAVLKDGRLMETGSSEPFFASAATAYARELLSLTPR